LAHAIEHIGSTVEHNLLLQLIIQAANAVINSVIFTTGQVISQQQATEAVIRAAIQGQTGSIDAIIQRAVGDIVTSNSKASAQVLSGTQDLTDIINRNIQNSTLEIGSLVSTLGTSLVVEVQTNRSILDSVLEILGSGLNVQITNNINLEDSLLTSLTDTVTATMRENNKTINAVIEGMGAIFGDAIESILRLIVQDILDDAAQLEKIAEAILVNKEDAGEVLEQVLDNDEGNIFGRAWSLITDQVSRQLAVSVEDLEEAIESVNFGDFDISSDMFCKFPTIEDSGFKDETNKNRMLWVANAITNLTFPFAIAQMETLRCSAVFSRDKPWKVLEPGDVAVMRHLGLLNDNDALIIMKMNGYSSGDAQLLLNSAQLLPNIDFIISAGFRGFIDDEAVDFALKQQGFNDAYTDLVRKVSVFVPPVQDLIVMAVREVFDPVRRAEGGLDEDFPPEFAELAGKLGVPRKVAEDYWAAHWSLPSIQMGFEMFQRQFIDKAQLESLMVVLDIAPGWREDIIKISFLPITRIDIRRLNKTKLVEGADLRKRYQDIGYSPDDAELLSKFTELLNEPDDSLNLDLASSLTRGTIIRLYKRGTLSGELALVLLIQGGIDPLSAKLFIDDADFDMEIKARSQEISVVLDQVRVELVTYSQGVDLLNEIDLPNRERELALLDLARIRDGKTKVPSKADLDKFLAASLIDDDVYTGMLERSGYSPEWAAMYLQLTSGEV